MNWAANKGGAKSTARTKIIVLEIGKNLMTLSVFLWALYGVTIEGRNPCLDTSSLPTISRREKVEGYN